MEKYHEAQMQKLTEVYIAKDLRKEIHCSEPGATSSAARTDKVFFGKLIFHREICISPTCLQVKS